MTTAQEVKHNQYHIHWRLHLFWTLAVIFFILGKLWWLVPIPGASILPVARTYPANFLDTVFLAIACALATRSIVVSLVKSFQKGIYPDSIIKFGEVGGYAAMWSCIKHRSGLRYFLLSFLVTGCTLLGSALASELQSSTKVYYHGGNNTTAAASLVSCQHSSANDYLLASSAYAQGLVNNSVTDASSLIQTTTLEQPMKSFMVSVVKSSLTPIDSYPPPMIQQSDTRVLRRRHYHHFTTITSASNAEATKEPCEQDKNNDNSSNTTTSSIGDTISKDCEQENNSMALNSGSTISNTTAINNHISNVTLAIGPNNATTISSNSTAYNISSIIASTPIAIFNTSKLMILQGVNNTALPYSTSSANSNSATIVKLNVYRYTTSDNREAVIIYSQDGTFNKGVYVSATATNYTCSVGCDQGVQIAADNATVAEAMYEAIQSGLGLYGTGASNALAMDILNGNSSSSSKLVDALFANPLCNSDEVGTLNAIYPYSASHLSTLAIVYLCLFVVLWLIGIYLIGYSEDTWTELAVSAYLLPQIINNSPDMFEKGDLAKETVNKEMFLDPEKGIMNFEPMHRHGYSVTTAVME